MRIFVLLISFVGCGFNSILLKTLNINIEVWFSHSLNQKKKYGFLFRHTLLIFDYCLKLYSLSVALLNLFEIICKKSEFYIN